MASMRGPSTAAGEQRRPGLLHRRRRRRVVLGTFRSWPDRGWRRRRAGNQVGAVTLVSGVAGAALGMEWGLRSRERERRVGWDDLDLASDAIRVLIN
jgi:hypothetical protein